MKQVKFGQTQTEKPAIIVGGMRLAELGPEKMNHFIHTALENGAYYFDYADIYGGGECEKVFGEAIKNDASLKREDFFLQSKCGIRSGFFDFSKEHILESVDGILQRMGIEYLDTLLLHRPDALMEPDEIAEAFDILESSGKVRGFGVSNFHPMQIELIKKYVKQPLQVNQLQFSIPVSEMISEGLEVNMITDGGNNRDGYILEYCRLHDITIQAWSPFQMPSWRGCFLGSPDYKELNDEINKLAEAYSVSPTTIASAWILRHPAGMQIVAGTSSEKRLLEIIEASNINLSRQEWYKLYLSAGHILP